METFLIKAVQLIVCLSILVIVHEFGHFMFSRIFKIRVEKFYLFFNPWFSLFKFKPKNSDTEYGIGWLPLGGYVKISGMIDESMDKEQLKLPPQDWEFRSKPALQRLCVMIGGVLFNFILALIIYSMMLFAWGDQYLPLKNVTNGMEFSQTVKDAGFHDGDVLVSADGRDLQMRDGVMGLNTLMSFIDAESVQVLRQGKPVTIHIPDGFGKKVISSHQVPYGIWMPTTVGDVQDSSKASLAGLQKGDSILSVNGLHVTSFSSLVKEVSKNVKKQVTLTYLRSGITKTATMELDSTGIMGIKSVNWSKKYQPKNVHYGFFESFPKGVTFGVQTLKAYIEQARFIFSKQGVKSLSGFGGIGSMFPPVWDWHAFWSMAAFLSIVLAFMNILPIPALDGGHILFLLYEVITRRKPNEKLMEYAQMGGMIILILLVVYANGSDILRLFIK